MRVQLIIILLLTQINLYSQGKDEFKISGFIKGENSKSPVLDCEITIVTPSGLTYKSKSDSNGYFKIDNISNLDDKFIVSIKKSKFFGKEMKIYFNNRAHDTIINVELKTIDISVRWLPEVYFEYNKGKPVKGYKEALSVLVQTLEANPTMIIKIIGYKDSQETNDLRMERANFILMKLVKLGIDKKRLLIGISDSPNILKENTLKENYTKGKFDSIFLTDEYIRSNSSLQESEKLRQLNRCVRFQMGGE